MGVEGGWSSRAEIPGLFCLLWVGWIGERGEGFWKPVPQGDQALGTVADGGQAEGTWEETMFALSRIRKGIEGKIQNDLKILSFKPL